MSQIEINPELLSTSTNKTILITGAARGIGAATASLFNAHGTNVVIADLEPLRADAEKLITEFTHPERGVFIPANIVDWAQLTACFKSAIARFGGIDIVVANAGIMESKPVLDVSAVDANGDLCESVDAQRVIDVNLKGTLNSKLYPEHLVLDLLGCIHAFQFQSVSYAPSNKSKSPPPRPIPPPIPNSHSIHTNKIHPPRHLDIGLLRRHGRLSLLRLEARRAGTPALIADRGAEPRR